MYETGPPHCLDPGTLETLGEDDFNGELKLKAFAAHFRLDMKNKVAHHFATVTVKMTVVFVLFAS